MKNSIMGKRTACSFNDYKKFSCFPEGALRTVGGWFTVVYSEDTDNLSWLENFDCSKDFMEPVLQSMKQNTENHLSDILYDINRMRKHISRTEDFARKFEHVPFSFVLCVFAIYKNGVDSDALIEVNKRNAEYLDVFVITCDQDEYGTKSITTWVRDHYDDDDEDIPCW